MLTPMAPAPFLRLLAHRLPQILMSASRMPIRVSMMHGMAMRGGRIA